MDLISRLYPDLDISLKKAGYDCDKDKYIKNYTVFSVVFSILFWLFFALIGIEGIINRDWPFYVAVILVILYFIIFMLVFIFMFNLHKFQIKRREVEVESDLLYSARYLLLKLESGSSILNSLIAVSTLNTRSAKYFMDVVSDIYLGDSLETAIKTSIKYSPSVLFQKILEEIRNSLKTGADVEQSLKSTLDDMMKEQMIKIKMYGKKLSPVSMMYMIVGAIFPSMGSAFLVIIMGFVSLSVGSGDVIIWVLLAVLAIIQVFFVMFFKSLKPQVMS